MSDLFPDAKIIRIDLSEHTIDVETIPGATYRKYPGGSSLGLYLIAKHGGLVDDPLGANNPLAFTVSPLTGLPVSGLSRMNVTAFSPLTNTIGDSQSGGFFPAALANSGYDGIFVTGKAPEPVYLWIDGDEVSLRDAGHLWGKTTLDTEHLITEETENSSLEICEIGPAGENLVKYACIVSRHTRSNGRTGMGAVMGSKNLKAIAVTKKPSRKPHDRDLFAALAKSVQQLLAENEAVAGLGKYGTDGDLAGLNEAGFLPTRNWTSGYFPEGGVTLAGSTMYDTILKERDTCFACAVRCKRVVEVSGVVDPDYGGPEYETVATFGSYLGIHDLAAVSYANQLCNAYGLDTISCGATIGFAMECYEKQLIGPEITDNLDLRFGNKEVVAPLIERIAYRKGFGNLLGEGSYRAAEAIGKDAIPLSITVKKSELPAHMPQFKPSVGVIYAVNPFGADHQSSEHDPVLLMPADSREMKRLALLGVYDTYSDTYSLDRNKVRYAFETQKYYSVLDTLCLCQFVWGPSWQLYGPDDLVKLCLAGIGWSTSLYELQQVGERRINLMRAINAQYGFAKDDDVLPERLFEPMADGPAQGVQLNRDDFYRARDYYYRLAGWDKETGNPTEVTLSKLSLDWVLDNT